MSAVHTTHLEDLQRLDDDCDLATARAESQETGPQLRAIRELGSFYRAHRVEVFVRARDYVSVRFAYTVAGLREGQLHHECQVHHISTDGAIS